MRNKLSYETITQSFGSSFSIRTFDQTAKNAIPTWHFHPELELVYINGGSGKRHVGQHLSYYRNGDLLLLGSNLPHFGFTNPQSQNESETVIQFNFDGLGESFLLAPEINKISELFEIAEYGIHFPSRTRNAIGPRIEALSEMPPFNRLLEFIRVLQTLAETDDYKILNDKKIKGDTKPQGDEKIDGIYGTIRKDFQNELSLSTIATEANMTVPAFCRYFKKQSGKTFTQFVNEYRILNACKLLSESSKMITTIAEESGYRNFSYFNKQFQKFTGRTPSNYRQENRQLIN